jgi:hypothetical protein
MAAIVLRWDHGSASSRREIIAEKISVERLVGDDGDASNRTQHRFDKATVVSLAWSEDDTDDPLRCRDRTRSSSGIGMSVPC